MIYFLGGIYDADDSHHQLGFFSKLYDNVVKIGRHFKFNSKKKITNCHFTELNIFTALFSCENSKRIFSAKIQNSIVEKKKSQFWRYSVRK